MINPLGWWEQRRARRRYMPRAQPARSGRTAKAAAIALVVIIAAAALLELRGGSGAEAELVEMATDAGREPLDLIEEGARTRRLIFLSDIPAAAAPKRLAEQAIARIAGSSGLDLVVLDVDANEQPYIDRYLATSPEDPSILLSRPRALKEATGVGRSYLDIYRTIWRANERLGAARRIRVVAADAPGWPPAGATAPSTAARLFGERAEHMATNVLERALGRDPGARVLFFVDGLNALKSGGGRIQTGGAAPSEFTWLAARMRERFPADVYTILVDATPARSINPDVAAYRGTVFADVLRRGGIEPGTGLRVTPLFDDVDRSPLRIVETTGISLTFEPGALPISELADVYVFLGS